MPISMTDIHKAIHGVRAEGKRRDDLEGLLVHYDDFIDLIKSIPQFNSGCSYEQSEEEGSFKLLGVKIIRADYIQRGCIFKVFKNETWADRRYDINKLDPIQHDQTPGSVSGSGSLFDSPVWSNYDIDNFQGKVDKIEVKPEPEPEPKEPKRNHSETRKIQLD